MISPLPWRTGRKVHRTIYDSGDRLIGVMDRPDDASLVVGAVARSLEADAVRNAALEEAATMLEGARADGAMCEQCATLADSIRGLKR